MPSAIALDLLTRIVNVQWPGGMFSFAGNISLDIHTMTDVGDTVTDVKFSWLGGSSKDGKSWESGGPTQAGLALFCCVRGKVGDQFVTIAAADVVVSGDTGVQMAFGTEPAAGVSHDDG